ncbi:MAG: urate hydroxylase PuuD, partial [Bdellovibrionota bacterium]
MAVSWVVYDLIWQSKLALEKNAVALTLSLLLAIGAAYLLCHCLSGRAAFIHLGAMFGTIMVTNVWMRILPSQQKMIDATKEGRKPDYNLSAKAKRRSVHNSYMTFPVLLTMISNHYANVTSGPNNWIHLVLLVIFGGAVRHVALAKT